MSNQSSYNSARNPLFRKIWRWKGPNHIRAFLWKLIHGKLLAKESCRGMNADSSCPRCNSSSETLMHLLRDCDEAHMFWSKVISPSYWSKFFSVRLLPCLEWNLSTKNIGIAPLSWFSYFSVAITAIWKDRNSLVVFSNSSMMSEGLWHSVASQTKLQNLLPFSDDRRVLLNIEWQPPPDGFLKINVDGAYNNQTRMVACGGIIRDAKGGFVQNLGSCSVLRAELLALPACIDFEAIIANRELRSFKQLIFGGGGLMETFKGLRQRDFVAMKTGFDSKIQEVDLMLKSMVEWKKSEGDDRIMKRKIIRKLVRVNLKQMKKREKTNIS